MNKNDEVTKFNYDKQGNLTQEQYLEGLNSYSYNSFNQTVKAVTKEGNTLVSRYDAEGLRCEIEENVLVETDKDYNLIARFTRGYEVVAANINDGNLESNRYYYTQDEQGSTIYITDKEQQVKNEYYYDAFGCVLDSREDVHNRITYTGQQYDPITQQYYLRARNYNPVIARFTQEDTYRGDGLGLYSYCHSNPVIYYDPSGYMVCGKNKKQASSVSGSTINRSSPASYYSYTELKKIIKEIQLSGRGKGFEAHHLLEKQFAQMFGENKGDIISVALTPLWHRNVGGSITGNNLDHLITSELDRILTKLGSSRAGCQEIWQAHRNVYEKIGQSDWANAIYEAYVKKLNIPY